MQAEPKWTYKMPSWSPIQFLSKEEVKQRKEQEALDRYDTRRACTSLHLSHCCVRRRRELTRRYHAMREIEYQEEEKRCREQATAERKEEDQPT